ncbi:MAG: YifB family Mg chelatase-like AAA ATPase [Anaerolineaceae bacterium]|nr:YifB family Mg chelatase-like AAA ATPase [Anaerolineaceae bacterium]
MLSIVRACAVVGLDACIIDVETDFNPRAGIPSFSLVGLPGSAVRESRERVRAAIRNSGLQFPNKSYVVNLSPADLPKHGPAYDLAIAVGVLAATDQVPEGALSEAIFLGELSLDGSVRHVKGVMPMANVARDEGFKTLYVPACDAPEAGLVDEIEIIPLESLGQLVEQVYGLNPVVPLDRSDWVDQDDSPPEGQMDFSDVRGQEHLKRALEVAAAGNHNLLMKGPPGAGKSLCAHALPGILPPLTREEALEATRIYSVADMLQSEEPLLRQRPFRAPHHTISQAGLVGGGPVPRPGEISLAHRGVLFLDELPEYGQRMLEVLRQPIEERRVTISRASGSLTFPANFQLLAAMNPCPCGHFGDMARNCSCSRTQVQRYQNRISGPMLDRIDMHVDVPRVEYDKLMAMEPGESSKTIRARVIAARERQANRFAEHPGLFANADMGPGEVQEMCQLSEEARQILDASVRQMRLGARALHRVLKLGRTIADLSASDIVSVEHVAEALQYRQSGQFSASGA